MFKASPTVMFFWCTVVSCVMVLPAILGDGEHHGCMRIKDFRMDCGTFMSPYCKFNAKYITIKPDGIEGGFGDAYFDTNDVDIELRCEFRAPEFGEMTVALIKFEEGGYDKVVHEFYNRNNNATKSGNIVAENQGVVEKDGVIKTNATLLSIDRVSKTTYTCLCPHVNVAKNLFQMRPWTNEFFYAFLTSFEPSIYSRSSSFYQVPVYEPCKVETCSEQKNGASKLDYCYETTTGPSLAKLNLKSKSEIEKLVKYCDYKYSAIKKNWITEDWAKGWRDRVLISRNFSDDIQDQLYHMLASKTLAEHVCGQRNLIQEATNEVRHYDWKKTFIHFKENWDQYNNITCNMLNKPSFPWFNPDEEEIGSLLLHTQWKYVGPVLNNLKLVFPPPREKSIRCKRHFRMLKGKNPTKEKDTHKILKFYAKTYPACLDSFEPELDNGTHWFELFFNKKPAYYDSKHFSVDNGNNTIVLKTLPQDIEIEISGAEIRTFKYESVDCSLYAWKRSEGIHEHKRTQLDVENTIVQHKTREWGPKSEMLFHFDIDSALISGFGDEQKMLVGCYVNYTYFCDNQPCDEMGRLKKMQFYVKPAPKISLIPHYSTENKRLNKCEGKYQGISWEKWDNVTSCACIMSISMCSPLKTTHIVQKSVLCILQPLRKTKPKVEKRNNKVLIVILSVMAVLIFTMGIAAAIFCNLKEKVVSVKKPEVRVLTLIEQEPVPESKTAVDQTQFFDTESSELTSTEKNKSHSSESTTQPKSEG